MKELEEINCELRRIVNLQFSVSNRLKNLEVEEHSQSAISQEHDISDCRGGFLHNATYAWLSYDCHFVVFNAKIGESVSSWTFRGVVTCVSQFPTQSGELPLLLIGVDNNASKLRDSSGLLCIFDCTTSRVLRAIRMPCAIEQVCIVSGGAEWEEFNDKRPDNILNEMDGIACVVLRNLQHIMIDLRRSTWHIYDLSAVMDETSPAEIELSTTKQVIARHPFNSEKHTAHNLLTSRIEQHIGFNRDNFEPLHGENLTTAIISSTKIGCLISGCLGRIIIWQNDGSVGWISAPIDENMTITHLALLEPTDDPRPFCYLWVVYEDESSKTPPLFRMYAMLFERKYCDRGMNLYFNLEAEPSLKLEFELSEADNVVGLCTVERNSNPEQTEFGIKRGEDNLLLISTNERILLFDLNQWYKEQMPQTITECQNPNSILAIYRTRSDIQSADSPVISFAYVPQTLQEYPTNGPSSPEELFYPNSLSLEWMELSLTKLTFWMTRGIQMDLLREMAMAGPIILIQPSETFHRCLSVGLVPFNSEFSFASDQNAQREMLLSLCLEQRWSTFLVKCAIEWSDGSASYLYPTFLKWGVQRASTIKMIADRLCIPLFDQSGSGIGEADVKTLRFCSQQFECLSNVVGKLPFVTADLTKQRRTLKRVSIYFQVLLWFYDVGLLPETQDLEEDTLPISLALKVPYPYEKLSGLYKMKREQVQTNNHSRNGNKENFFIDELITRECPALKGQWERESGTAMGGYYPPPSLQSLLRSYLTDCHQNESNEMNCKHQITIYLLMDLAMLLQRLYPGVDQLIKYPSAFKMSPSLIKLTQAFWLLDHEDYQGFLDMMTGQLVSDSDVKDWHHRLVLRTLVRNNQHKLALVYLRVRKPPLSSMEEQGMALTLSVEHGLVQSAFHRRPPCHYEQLLTCFFQACKTYGKLDDILHLALDSEEEDVFVKFLEKDKTEDLKLLYYLQRCRYTEAISGHPIVQYQSNFTKDIQSTSLGMLGAYNTTLPEVTKQFSTNIAGMNVNIDMDPRYPRPMSHCKSHDRLRSIHETVIAKAKETYLRGEKCQIPFISAPCMSLKSNDYSSNMNCVLFPTLIRKNRLKRTVDQIYSEDGNDNGTPDDAKRRKLADESTPDTLTTKDLGLAATFETPLVKRKCKASTDTVSETPQSILKIRQLIRNSTSPGIASEATDGSFNEKERKANRQIRFNINQSKKTLIYEHANEKDEEDNGRVSAESEGNEVSSNINLTNKSYTESAVLSGNSSISCKNYYHPRPRPSLRRSALQSSVESSQESSANVKKVDGSVTTSLATDEINKTPFVANIPRRRSSLLSASIYLSPVLSSDSSIDVSGSLKRLERSTPQSRWRLSIERDRKSKFGVSSTPLTKAIISRVRVNTELESSTNDAHRLEEDLIARSELERSSNIERPNYSTSDLPRRQDRLEESIEDENRQIESRYNNGSIARTDNTRLQNLYEEQPMLSESKKVAESNLTLSDESDEELLRLRDDEEDSDEHEEPFESLSNTFENAPMQMENKECTFRLSETCNRENRIEEHCITKPNGLQESRRTMGDLTDDESSKSEDAMRLVYNTVDNNENEGYLTQTVYTENVLYDPSNITDDEADFNIKETEKPKTRNGKFSNSREQYLVRGMKEDDESNEANQISSRKEKECSESSKGSTHADDNDDNTLGGFEKTRASYRLHNNRMSAELQEQLLETESSSKDEKTQIESKDEQSVRITRSRRADSIAKDTDKDAANVSSQQVGTERVTRLRRASSMTKDLTILHAEKPARLRRASSMTKDIVSSSVTVDLRRITSSGNSVDVQTPTKRGRRSASLAKEIFRNEIKDDNSETVKELAVRRSTRLTTSAKKDLSETSKIMSEKLSSSSKLNDDEEDGNTRKKSLRGKRSSISSGKGTTSDSVESLITNLHKAEPENVEVKTTRRRGSSVPKEIITTQTGRGRRSSSVTKEITSKAAEAIEESRKLRSSIARHTEEIVNSPAANTRSRRLSIQSIPEELEDILSKSSRETRKEVKQTIGRERRASSADVLHKEIKRKSRNIASITVEPIVEESADNDDQTELEEDEKIDNEEQNVPLQKTRKKRAVSIATVEEVKKNTTKRKGRKRQTSTDQETSNLFSFSQPEKTDDMPLDEKDIGEVPNYVFSPPQTRSKNIASNQHRRKLKSFIPNPYQEGEQHVTVQETHDIIESGHCPRIIINTYGSRFRTKFIVPKKSKNTMQ